MQPNNRYVPTTVEDIKAAFAIPGKESEFVYGPSTLAGGLMLASLAIPKEIAWQEAEDFSNNGYYTPSTRVTKKSRAIEIFKNNQSKIRDAIIVMMVAELEIHRIAACDLYRWCDQNRKEIMFNDGGSVPTDDDDEGDF